MSAKFTSKQDLSRLENFFKAVQQLESKKVTYGYYDDPHYCGLNTATLAAIHQNGWNGLPARNFMTSASVMFRKDLAKLQKELFGHLAAGGTNIDAQLRSIGQAGANKIKYVIETGSFNINKVSDAWADVKGFSDAMYHYSDLKEATTFKVTKNSARK